METYQHIKNNSSVLYFIQYIKKVIALEWLKPVSSAKY